MKITNNFARFAILLGVFVTTLSLVGWSPSGGDKTVIVGASNNTTDFQGFIAGNNNIVIQ